jgi:hypothetical protein
VRETPQAGARWGYHLTTKGEADDGATLPNSFTSSEIRSNGSEIFSLDKMPVASSAWPQGIPEIFDLRF